MNRCSPIELRKALEVAHKYAATGVDFVSIPVRNQEHKEELVEQMKKALSDIVSDAEKLEANATIPFP